MSSSDVKVKEKLEMKDYRLQKEQPEHWQSALFHQPFFSCGILYIMGFSTPINPDTIKSGFQDTLLRHPAFSSLQVVHNKSRGSMKWVPTKPEIERHVIIPSLDTKTGSPDKLVEDYISNLRSTPYDYSKPLWEFHILNIKTSEAEATGVFKIHHSMGDGSSIVSLLFALSRKASDPNNLPLLPQQKRHQKQVGKHGLITRYLAMLWSMSVLSWNTISNFLWSLIATFLIFKDTDTPFRHLPNAEYTPRRFVHRTVSLDDIKLLKNVMNTTISTVGLGITNAALSRYTHRIQGESKGMKIWKIFSSLKRYLKILVLVDVRKNAGVQPLADMMEEKSKGKWGNMLGFLFIHLKIQKLEDPLEYIRQAKSTFDGKKNTLESTLSHYLGSLSAKLFGAKFTSAVTYCLFSQATLLFSSMVGPSEEITFFDHPVTYLCPAAYGTPQAMVIHMHSYADKITFGFAVDERNILDPHLLCDDFVESLKLMKRAATAKC